MEAKSRIATQSPGTRARSALATFVISAIIAGTSAAAGPSSPQLQSEVRDQDAKFFKLMFEVCDPDAMSRMVTPDFEMYHDRGGVVAKGEPEFIANYTKDCRSWTKPGAVRARRVLVPETFGVYPVPGYGAIEGGSHDFYAGVEGKPEVKVGRGRFTQLWRRDADGWRLSRVFSYDHVDAAPPRP